MYEEKFDILKITLTRCLGSPSSSKMAAIHIPFTSCVGEKRCEELKKVPQYIQDHPY
jgi:hypothetical protein